MLCASWRLENSTVRSSRVGKTGEISSPGRKKPKTAPPPEAEPSILINDLSQAASSMIAVATQQPVAPVAKAPDAKTAQAEALVSAVRKDATGATGAFTKAEEDFFNEGYEQEKQHQAAPRVQHDGFDDLDEGYQPTNFWDRLRGKAIPILFRLYRPKRRCAQAQYRKRTELAVELVNLVESWVPPGFRLFVAADSEYACKTLVPRLTKPTTFVGPMNMDASLYEPAGSYSGMGRPRAKGKRLSSPRQLAANSSVPWMRVTIRAYGRHVEVLTKTCTCLWYTVAGTRMVKMALTRDPRCRIEDRAYFATDPGMSVEELLQRFSWRWTIEVCFRGAKQYLGLEDPQNGWGRRKTSSHRRPRRPGPQPRGKQGEIATLHTVPIVFVSYALVVLWYLQHGRYLRDVRLVRERAPWYRSKRTPSFTDMLVALRRETWAGRLSQDPHNPRTRRKFRQRLCAALLAA